MTRWDDALKAYDDECDVLEDVRARYGGYLHYAFNELNSVVQTHLGWSGNIDEDGPKSAWSAKPGCVAIRAWAPSAWGGRKGCLALGIDLDVRSGFSPSEGGNRRRLFTESAKAAIGGQLPGKPPEGISHGEIEGNFICLAFVEHGADVASALRAKVSELIPLVDALHTSTERCSWLERALEPAAKRSVPTKSPGVTWLDTKLRRWTAGRFVELDQTEPTRNVWVTALPPGRLVLTYWGARAGAELSATLGASEVIVENQGVDSHSLLLLDEARVAELCVRNDATAIEALALKAFAEYFGVMEKASR